MTSSLSVGRRDDLGGVHGSSSGLGGVGEDGGMADAVAPVALASLAAAAGHPGARWRLDAEDLQANLVWLGVGDRIQTHRNDEIEVLVVVICHLRPGRADP